MWSADGNCPRWFVKGDELAESCRAKDRTTTAELQSSFPRSVLESRVVKVGRRGAFFLWKGAFDACKHVESMFGVHANWHAVAERLVNPFLIVKAEVRTLIRFLRIKCAFEILGMADGADDIGFGAGLAPGMNCGRFESSIAGVFAIGPVVALQIVPEIFDRIEFG